MMKPYHLTIGEISDKLKTNMITGLSEVEVNSRQSQYGFNQLIQKSGKGSFSIFLSQFKDILIWILIVASVISFAIGETADAVIILIIVFLNAIFGFYQEYNAEKSLEALKRLQIPEAKVVREGKIKTVSSIQIVPGDIVNLNAGDYIPADGRLIEAMQLTIEESQLTGESLPVDKTTDVLKVENPSLGDRYNMVYSTSMVTSGRGKMLVTEIGMKTEIGKIAGMLDEKEEMTPLQIRLAELGKILGIAAVAVSVIMFMIGYFQGRDLLEMFMLSISLAVAAIPEGLPAIVTIVLSLGVKRMSEKNAIIRKLPAVETLGSASIVCSDKTGTLTQNKMTVVKIATDTIVEVKALKGQSLKSQYQKLMTIATLCNDSNLEEKNGEIIGIGDPTETALIFMGSDFGIDKKVIEQENPRVFEIPFDSNRKRMSTVHQNPEGGYQLMVKGAPDQLLKKCTRRLLNGTIIELDDEQRQIIESQNIEMSKQALRVLGYAYKPLDNKPESQDGLEENLIYLGLSGMIDPPREDVKESIEMAMQAGIKTVMITGDYKETAMAIAIELGIFKDGDLALSGSEIDDMSEEAFKEIAPKISVYARVSPEHKVKIVKALRANNNIVSMTGDGVNDAPALKAADIGCAMGITGTDVSKEASDLILTDDNFSTIIAAVEEGRVIYDNIRRAINFLLSSNIGEILTLLVAILLGFEAPLLAIHILWINLVTDSFPALALGVEPKESDVMKRSPRDPNEGIFANGLGLRIILQGVMIGTITLIAFFIGYQHNIDIARTMAFLTLAGTQLTHSFNMRSFERPVYEIGWFTNKKLLQGVGVSLLLIVLIYIIKPLRMVFKLTLIAPNLLLIVIGLILLPLIIVDSVKFIKSHKK